MLLQERIAGINFDSDQDDEDDEDYVGGDDFLNQSVLARTAKTDNGDDEMQEDEEDEDEIDKNDHEKEVKLSAAKGRAKSVKELRERLQARLNELRGKRGLSGEEALDDDDDDEEEDEDENKEGEEEQRKVVMENKHKNKNKSKSKEDKKKRKEKKKQKKPPKKKAKKEQPAKAETPAPQPNGTGQPGSTKSTATDRSDKAAKRKNQDGTFEFGQLDFSTSEPIPTYLEKKRKHENRRQLLEKVDPPAGVTHT